MQLIISDCFEIFMKSTLESSSLFTMIGKVLKFIDLGQDYVKILQILNKALDQLQNCKIQYKIRISAADLVLEIGNLLLGNLNSLIGCPHD